MELSSASKQGTTAKITWAERDQIAARNRALLDRDLREKRLFFASRPYEAHVQFSNFCNMSCVMCWDGDNPPLKKMSPLVLDRVRNEIAPDLVVITPHDGSEPTVITWAETVALVKDYSVQLELVTNGQLFDEQKFNEVKDHIEMLVVSIDSHVPEVFEKIRPGAKAHTVYRNAATVARLCERHQIECIAQAVFMTPNAPHMPDMVAWVADHGFQVMNVVQMIDVNRRSWHLDATMHFSAEYLDWIKKQCIAVAKEREINLGWYLSGSEWYDFREDKRRVDARESKILNDYRDGQMRFRHPGFCKYAYDRLRIATDGQISPCGLDGDRELNLGTLSEQSFEEIWNGPTARDLRRAHYTWDYPSLCESCRYVDRLPAQEAMAFLDHYLFQVGTDRDRVEPTLAIESPDHMLRTQAPPVFVVRKPATEVSGYQLVISLGGERDGTHFLNLERRGGSDGVVQLEMRDTDWTAFTTNVGYWWTIIGTGRERNEPLVRTPEIRCLIRHEPLPRIEHSRLKYKDGGHFSFMYLGGNRQLGWKARGELPSRPPLRNRGQKPVRGPRFVNRRMDRGVPVDGKMSADAYLEMVRHVQDVVKNALPEGAIGVVATRGDEALLQVEGRELRHFPADEYGRYAGYHPPNDRWVIQRLEQAHAAGVEFLVIPASMRWWLDYYTELIDYLRNRYGDAIVDDRERCTIFRLRKVERQELEAPDHGPALIELADRTLGYGGHHRLAFRRFHASGDEAFPRFARDAHGYRLIDSEFRTFIDWVSGGGPVILGYRHPAVTEAIRTQLPAGPTLTLTHPIEVEVASLLTKMVPCADMVAFGKNGSDALAAAVRLARAITGREMILQYGGHGFHDWFVAVHGVAGVPSALGELVRSFPYNDIDALEALFQEHPRAAAAVVMEPVNLELPKPGYLEAVRELTKHHGALLIFDEMVTGFRLANGGAQERFGVTPDLACLGKGLANGMPLSAVVGKREYMERLPEIAYGMTFRGETLSLAAARGVLRVLIEVPVADHLEQIGRGVRDAFERACAKEGVAAALLGPEARMTFVFGDNAAVPPERLEAAFVIDCARHGVLTNGNILPSLAHDDDAVSRTADAFGSALSPVKQLVEAGGAAVSQAMQAGFERFSSVKAGSLPAGFIDAARDEGSRLILRGWMLSKDGDACTIEAIGPSGETQVAERVARPDVVRIWPNAPGARDAGFSLVLPAEKFTLSGRYSFELRARRSDETIFTCEITRPLMHLSSDLGPSCWNDSGVLSL